MNSIKSKINHFIFMYYIRISNEYYFYRDIHKRYSNFIRNIIFKYQYFIDVKDMILICEKVSARSLESYIKDDRLKNPVWWAIVDSKIKY